MNDRLKELFECLVDRGIIKPVSYIDADVNVYDVQAFNEFKNLVADKDVSDDEDYRELQEEKWGLEDDLADLEDENDELKNDIKKLKKRIKELQEENAELKGDVKYLENWTSDDDE